MKFWNKVILELDKSDKDFQAIYNIMMSNFSNEVFSKNVKLNRIYETTYLELDDLVKRTANGIVTITKNVPKDEFIGIKMDNSNNFVAAFYGALMAGFMPLLINTRNSIETNESIIKKTNIKYIITSESGDLLDINELIKFDPISSDKVIWSNMVALTTSGTTGTPKICLYDGQAISSQIHSAREAISLNKLVKNNRKANISILAFLPFYHVFGFVGNLMWFGFFGRTFVFLENMDPKTIQNTIKLTKTTHMLSIPLVWNGVANNVIQTAKKRNQEDKFNSAINFSIKLQSVFPSFGRWIVRKFLFKKVREQIFGDSLSFLVSGGSYLNENTLRIINGLGYPLFNGFGMTEIGIYSVELSNKASERIKGNIGVAFSNYTYKLDENNQLLVKGPSILAGYYENDRINYLDKDEWFMTNDIFIRESNGSLHHDYRHDEMIIGENGENISPHQIENKFQLPFAKHVVVVGYLNGDNKYVKTLVIELVPNYSKLQHSQTIMDVFAVIGKLPHQEVINDVFIVSEPIPVLLESKIQRNLIRKELVNKTIIGELISQSDYLGIVEINNSAVLQTLEDVIEVFGKVLDLDIKTIQKDSHFALDLNGSSLEYFSLINELSLKYNMEFNIDEENFFSTPISFSNYIISQIK